MCKDFQSVHGDEQQRAQFLLTHVTGTEGPWSSSYMMVLHVFASTQVFLFILSTHCGMALFVSLQQSRKRKSEKHVKHAVSLILLFFFKFNLIFGITSRTKRRGRGSRDSDPYL